jgi:hypothetical protein
MKFNVGDYVLKEYTDGSIIIGKVYSIIPKREHGGMDINVEIFKWINQDGERVVEPGGSCYLWLHFKTKRFVKLTEAEVLAWLI